MYEGGESTAEGKRRPRAREISKRLGSNALPYPPGGGCADWQKATAEGGRRSGGRQAGEGERKEGWGSEKGGGKCVSQSARQKVTFVLLRSPLRRDVWAQSGADEKQKLVYFSTAAKRQRFLTRRLQNAEKFNNNFNNSQRPPARCSPP